MAAFAPDGIVTRKKKIILPLVELVKNGAPGAQERAAMVMDDAVSFDAVQIFLKQKTADLSENFPMRHLEEKCAN